MCGIGILRAYAAPAMVTSKTSPTNSQFPLRLGFVPLSDCAPIAVAKEMGIFDKFGLNVALSRELGWASVRDKIYYGELDAAQSIAGIAFALGLGFSELRCDIAVPLILNLHGNAITLSTELNEDRIGKGEGLREFLAHSWKKDRPFTLAATHRFASHHILLHAWLNRHKIFAPKDVEIVFLPPPLMPKQLKSGHIDGYCVGEPWNSEAIINGSGWCPVTSAELSHGHPEKVLLMSGRFLKECRDESVQLVAALLEACKLCQDPNFHDDLIQILSMPAYTGASTQVLTNSLTGKLVTNSPGARNSFHVFHGDNVNQPTVEKASWVLAGLRNIGALPEITAGSLSRIYREDIYHAAQQCIQRV